jgi:hypothetical protein
MKHRITKVTAYEFLFEWEEIEEAPVVNKGDIFEHEGVKYKVEFFEKVFAEEAYTSIMVIASVVELGNRP